MTASSDHISVAEAKARLVAKFKEGGDLTHEEAAKVAGAYWMAAPPATDPSCEFCAIARGENTAAEVVCEDENWVAFFPLNPATPGHTLVIPRVHVSDLWEVDALLGGDLMAAAIRVGRAIKASLNPEGMNWITSAGEAAEQTVFHLHLHVVPRWRRDGFGRIWPVARGAV